MQHSRNSTEHMRDIVQAQQVSNQLIPDSFYRHDQALKYALEAIQKIDVSLNSMK